VIGSLRGTLLDRRASEVLLEVGGVGYRVQVGPSTAARLPSVGTEVFVHVHHHLREDHQSLYGFLTASERECFENLIAAHGVGPSLAMAVLSVHSPGQLVQILADGDVAALCLVPGVGKKTAARLLVELRAKLDVDSFAAGTVAAGPVPDRSAAEPAAGSPRTVVRQALGELGYSTDEIRAALDGLDAGGDTASLDETALLRAALQRLAGGR